MPACADHKVVEEKNWAERQGQDPELRQMRQWKEQQLPPAEVSDPLPPYVKQLRREWDQIVLRVGVWIGDLPGHHP